MSADRVAPGQVWVDNDPRVHLHGKRFVEVVRVDGSHATVRGYRTHILPNGKIKKVYSRTTRIRLDRFRPTSTGYRRVS